MFFIASKVLSFLIQPLVWVFTFLILSILTKNHKSKRKFIVFSISILFIFSNPFIFNFVSYNWEVKTINPKDITDTFEVAVVLGGICSYDEKNNLTRFYSNSDRILNILPLYFDGRVKNILISGAQVN